MDQKKTIKILTIVSLAAVAILSLLLAIKNRSENAIPGNNDTDIIYKNLNPIEKNIIKILKQYEVPKDKKDLEIALLIETGIREIKAVIPKGRPMEEVIFSLQTAAKGTKYQLVDSYINGKNTRAELTFKSTKKNRENIIVRLRRGQKYASYIADLSIIVSDLHTISQKDRTRFLSYDKGKINYILDAWDKNLDSSYSILNRYDAPVIIGFPLESKITRENKKCQFTIFLDDSPEMIKRKVDDLLRHTPQIQGVATVGGSRVLAASSTTEPLLKKLKKHNLILFDRRKELKNSVTAKKIAEKENLTYLIPNSPIKSTNEKEIKAELKKAVYKASTYGRTTIWFPASGALIEAIEELTPFFEDRGVKLSSVRKSYK